jgi:hypothetical protein
MNTKDEVNEALSLLFGDELAAVWWTVPLPAFNGKTAEWLWNNNQQELVLFRVRLYNE